MAEIRVFISYLQKSVAFYGGAQSLEGNLAKPLGSHGTRKKVECWRAKNYNGYTFHVKNNPPLYKKQDNTISVFYFVSLGKIIKW